MAAIILGQARAHPPGRASRWAPRDWPGPPPQLQSRRARGRWPRIWVPTPQSQRGARADWMSKVPPGGYPRLTPHARRRSGRTAQLAAGGGVLGRPLPRPDSPQGQPRRPGPRAARSAAAKTRRGGSERARSQLLRGPAAALGMLSAAAAPPSANSEARAPRPWGRERRRRRAGVVRHPRTAANFAASPELARARLLPYKPDQTQSPPPPPSQPESWRLRPPKCCRCRQPLPTSGGPTGKPSVAGAGGAAVGVRAGGGGLQEPEAPAGSLLPSALAADPLRAPFLPQPLEGQQRVKSAPSHRERGPLQPPRPPAALLGACPEPPGAAEPRMRHRSPAGV
ncbi:basic salivary proline-rich protein 3-like [Muntiacus reevesi]|uniref:basic salivary proline-rich protein 3-like n=1 Tax=Muntiacus reevesi TaxID=9886 RepID=UPI003306F74E